MQDAKLRDLSRELARRRWDRTAHERQEAKLRRLIADGPELTEERAEYLRSLIVPTASAER